MSEVFWIGIGFLLVGAAFCSRNKPIGLPGIFVGVILLVIFMITCGVEMAFARDPDGRYADSKLKPWFDSLKSGFGACCSDADGTALLGTEWEVKDGHYRVLIKGEWIDVPDEAVLKVPNLSGRTIVWPIVQGNNRPDGGWQSSTGVRCFIPGAMI